MIELLTGENDFELKRAVNQRRSEFEGEAELLDGTQLSMKDLPDIFSGQTLFSSKRLIVISGASENGDIWPAIPEWGTKATNDTTVLLLEPKPDKRTSTYKWLKKNATVHEFPAWSERDTGKAEEWLRFAAKQQGSELTHAVARLIVSRVGTDQWELGHALDKLLLSGATDEASASELFEPRTEENVFELFETALRGDSTGIIRMIKTLRLSEEAYRVFGLLSGQAFQLAALVYATEGDRNVASDFAVSPYALNKLRPYASSMSTTRLIAIVGAFAKSDERLKTSQVDPWLVIEHTLLAVASES